MKHVIVVTLDCHLSLDKHISSVCKSASYHIRSLHHICSAITDDMAKSVASSLVCSRLDYANPLLFGTTQKIISGSQLINALNLNLPRWCTTFSTFNLLISVLCSIITLPHVLCILPTPIFCQFHVSTQPLPPAVLVLQPHSLELTTL